MVEGTASQGVAHASDRCIPCRGEEERAEKGHRKVRQDSTRPVPSQPLSGHADVVTATGCLEEEGSLQSPPPSQQERNLSQMLPHPKTLQPL